MLGINFDKARGSYLLDCIGGNKPIEPSDKSRGWTVHDSLCLAGACFFHAMSHGPVMHPGGVDPARLSRERREAIEKDFYSDLHAAIEFYSHLCQRVQDGDYDDTYGPKVVAAVEEREGKKVLVPSQGVKQS